MPDKRRHRGGLIHVRAGTNSSREQNGSERGAVDRLVEGQRLLRGVGPYATSGTSRTLTSPRSIVRRATDTGSESRRGPALPGFR